VMLAWLFIGYCARREMPRLLTKQRVYCDIPINSDQINEDAIIDAVRSCLMRHGMDSINYEPRIDTRALPPFRYLVLADNSVYQVSFVNHRDDDIFYAKVLIGDQVCSIEAYWSR
jgi:hypothetical protein